MIQPAESSSDETLNDCGDKKQEPRYLPTPEEIRAECLAIQAEWDEATRLSRAGFTEMPFTVEEAKASRPRRSLVDNNY